MEEEDTLLFSQISVDEAGDDLIFCNARLLSNLLHNFLLKFLPCFSFEHSFVKFNALNLCF